MWPLLLIYAAPFLAMLVIVASLAYHVVGLERRIRDLER